MVCELNLSQFFSKKSTRPIFFFGIIRHHFIASRFCHLLLGLSTYLLFDWRVDSLCFFLLSVQNPIFCKNHSDFNGKCNKSIIIKLTSSAVLIHRYNYILSTTDLPFFSSSFIIFKKWWPIFLLNLKFHLGDYYKYSFSKTFGFNYSLPFIRNTN